MTPDQELELEREYDEYMQAQYMAEHEEGVCRDGPRDEFKAGARWMAERKDAEIKRLREALERLACFNEATAAAHKALAGEGE